MWFKLNICFPSQGLEFYFMLGRGFLCDQPRIKTLGVESQSQFSAGACSVWFYEERVLRSLHLASFRLCLHVPFPFSDFTLHPFIVINHNHEYDYMLSPPSKSQDLVVVLGIPNTHWPSQKPESHLQSFLFTSHSNALTISSKHLSNYFLLFNIFVLSLIQTLVTSHLSKVIYSCACLQSLPIPVCPIQCPLFSHFCVCLYVCMLGVYEYIYMCVCVLYLYLSLF